MPWTQNARPGRRGFPQAIAQGVLQDTPLCQLALPGCTRTATEVDHRLNWAQGIAQGMTTREIDSVDNAQAVCVNCHKIKTQTEAAQGRAQASVAKPTQRHPGLRPSQPTPAQSSCPPHQGIGRHRW